MIFNKKAGITFNQIISMIMALLVLGVLMYLLFGTTDNAVANIQNCPGTCRDACNYPTEQQYASVCRQGNEVNNDEVCCVTWEQLTTIKNANESNESEIDGEITDSNNPSQSQNPTIEVRLGDSDEKVSSTRKDLRVGSSYTFNVWGFGVENGRCQIQVLDENNNRVPEGEMRWVEEEICIDSNLNENENQRDTMTGRQNILSNTFSPTNENEGSYTLQIRLLDSQDTQIQSIRIPIRVIN